MWFASWGLESLRDGGKRSPAAWRNVLYLSKDLILLLCWTEKAFNLKTTSDIKKETLLWNVRWLAALPADYLDGKVYRRKENLETTTQSMVNRRGIDRRRITGVGLLLQTGRTVAAAALLEVTLSISRRNNTNKWIFFPRALVLGSQGWGVPCRALTDFHSWHQQSVFPQIWIDVMVPHLFCCRGMP